MIELKIVELFILVFIFFCTIIVLNFVMNSFFIYIKIEKAKDTIVKSLKNTIKSNEECIKNLEKLGVLPKTVDVVFRVKEGNLMTIDFKRELEIKKES